MRREGITIETIRVTLVVCCVLSFAAASEGAVAAENRAARPAARKVEKLACALGTHDSIQAERLELAEELELVRRMIQFNEVLEESVRELEPHRLVFYLLELAGEFHRYYNRHRVVSEDRELSRARLLLLENVQKIIRRGLEILGVAAPDKMANRAEAEAAPT